MMMMIENAVPNWKDHFLSSKMNTDGAAAAAATPPLLMSMLAQQRGDLGGPRPKKRFSESSFGGLDIASLTGGGGGGENGGGVHQDILMMLRGLQIASSGNDILDVAQS